MLRRILGRPRKKPEVTLPVEPGFDKIGPKVGAGRKLTPAEFRARKPRERPAPFVKPPSKKPASSGKIFRGEMGTLTKEELQKRFPQKPFPTLIQRKRR